MLVWVCRGEKCSSTYGKACINRPLRGAIQSGRYRQVVSKTRFSKTYQFSEALLNSGECCGTHAYSIRNDKPLRSCASGGITRFSLANLHNGGCFDRKCGVRATIFLAFCR